jgi:N-acetylmuramoyl-L-alanine amidase CwlA
MKATHVALHKLEHVALSMMRERNDAVALLVKHKDTICKECDQRPCENGGACVLRAVTPR